MTDAVGIIEALRLDALGPATFQARSAEGGGAVVFGGQLLGQAIVAASLCVPDKQVKSLHTVFARGAAREHPLEIDVDVMHRGRSFASATVTIGQGDRLCTRSLVLLEAPAADLIRFATPVPEVSPPEATPVAPESSDEWEIRVVDGIDISDPAAVGPARLDVWTRFPGAPADPATNQALLAYASDGFLIGTAMRPHAGVGQSLAHDTIATSVLTQTVAFHEPFAASEWMLLAQTSPYAGLGRSFGRADVYRPDGALIASFSQENMIREN